MSEIHPVEELTSEHRLIEKVMTGLERQLAREGGPFPADFVGRALEFFVEFADANHHYKEEEVLFPALAAQGFPTEGGPIGMMLYEHTVGRKLLAGIREELAGARAGDERAIASVRDYAAQYIQLLRQHIWKEDNILFKMAQQALDGPAVEQVRARFGAGTKCTPEAARQHAEFAAGLA